MDLSQLVAVPSKKKRALESSSNYDLRVCRAACGMFKAINGGRQAGAGGQGPGHRIHHKTGAAEPYFRPEFRLVLSQKKSTHTWFNVEESTHMHEKN